MEEEKNNNHSFEIESLHIHHQAFMRDFDCLFRPNGLFSEREIRDILENPIKNHKMAKRISNIIYAKNGVVTNAIDTMTSLLNLNNIIVGKNQENKDKMKQVLEIINDKNFIRDVLHTIMVDGTCFYYFETVKPKSPKKKYLNDWDVSQIVEINERYFNSAIISLPYEYTRIIGKRNGRYELAFDLEYFNQYESVERESKLNKYPKEIRDEYYKWKKRADKDNGNWIRLNSDKTLCKKIKCKETEPWGRPLAIAAFDDIFYKDKFINTKRNILDNVNNQIFYQTLPEGERKGSCSLTSDQQRDQHNKVKEAVVTKNNIGGISFFSVAAGTKIDQIKVDTNIFDETNEKNLDNEIALDLGICASLIGAANSSSYSSQQTNLELITAKLYSWLEDIVKDLNYVINQNVIKDDEDFVEVSYFPTSIVNNDKFFDKMRTLYLETGGSLKYLIAATGLNPDTYLKCLDTEIEEGVFNKYTPHLTSYTATSEDNKNGRPTDDDSQNVNTIQTKVNDSNNQPKPSV